MTDRGARARLKYSPAVLLVAIADSLRFADPDLWGHVRFGEAMLRAHGLIFRDPYSYSAAGHLWLNHEWLAEIALAGAYDALGVVGLKLLKLALTSATIVALAFAEAETDAPAPAQLGVLLATSLAIAPCVQFRPQMFTLAAFAALLLFLARRTYRVDEDFRLRRLVPDEVLTPQKIVEHTAVQVVRVNECDRAGWMPLSRGKLAGDETAGCEQQNRECREACVGERPRLVGKLESI